ncbi:MAG TPA: tRNA (adenosine(37)-N6)-threonylcarbamoyltransferase complex dimerization subunit type 1 TsaB [Candidatus Limnocylindrales bacterium]|nr:tRNA (adenosine(37)-N6)-threonylcarbamoyltransferase complex dimerization subunit type 1 TsaB [Candidatus Limnocylindrales bacterium]
MSRRLLVIDTATRRAVVALADGDGALVGTRTWDSPHRHGEHLLTQLDSLLAEAGLSPDRIELVAVGAGPGSFTGLRIGLATAMVIAYTVGCPIIGLSTTAALARAALAEGSLAVVLPAGAADRYVARYQSGRELAPPRLAQSTQVQAVLEHGDAVAAVDLADDELGRSAAALGRQAQEGMAAALATMSAEALAAGRADELAALVPSYVALPRGVAAGEPEMAWSPDLR